MPYFVLAVRNVSAARGNIEHYFGQGGCTKEEIIDDLVSDGSSRPADMVTAIGSHCTVVDSKLPLPDGFALILGWTDNQSRQQLVADIAALDDPFDRFSLFGSEAVAGAARWLDCLAFNGTHNDAPIRVIAIVARDGPIGALAEDVWVRGMTQPEHITTDYVFNS